MKIETDFSELVAAADAAAERVQVSARIAELINTMPKCGVSFPNGYEKPVYTMPKWRQEFEHDQIAIYISAEDGDGVADYWGEFNGGDMYIHPKLNAWAESHGSYFEWENAGCIVAYFAGVKS